MPAALNFTLKGTGAAVTLPMTSNDGVSAPITIVGANLVSAEAAQTLQIFGRKRTYTLNFGNLDDPQYDALVAFVDGRQGSGPFILTDPRDTAGVTHLVNFNAGDAPLTDSSPIAGLRTGVALTLVEV